MSNYQCMNCMCGYDDDISSICPHCGYDKNQVVNEQNILLPGTVLNERYLVGNKINDNINGFCYAAWDNYISARVKIKEYYPSEYCSRTFNNPEIIVADAVKTKFEKGREMFLKKGEDFRKVPAEITGLVKTLDCFSQNNTSYIVIEYVGGTSVGEVVSRSKMSWSSFGNIIKPVVATLAAIHSAGLVIQSLNLENIVVTPDRQVKITDYECHNNDKVIESRSVIRQQDAYLPIELYRTGSAITPACDVYSLAAVIYKTLTGVEVPPAVVRAKSDKLKPISAFSEIDKNVENAVLNALAVEANDRTADCNMFFAELFGEQKVERRQKSTGKKKKTAAIISAASVAAICVIVGLFLLLSPKSAKADDTKGIDIIPDLKGLTVSQADKEIADLEKKLNKEYKISVSLQTDEDTIPDSDKKRDGKIANQTPKAGQAIEDGTTEITVTVKLYSYSADADEIDDRKVKMPDTVDEEKSKAINLLADAGLENVKIGSYEYSNTVAAGNVISQNYESGKQIAASSEIILVISNGPMPTTAAPYVPSYTPPKSTEKPKTQTETKPEKTSEPEVEEQLEEDGDDFFG